MVLKGQRRRRGRRTEAECLKAEWEKLKYYQGKKYDPIFEDYGLQTERGLRYSVRLFWRHLLK